MRGPDRGRSARSEDRLRTLCRDRTRWIPRAGTKTLSRFVDGAYPRCQLSAVRPQYGHAAPDRYPNSGRLSKTRAKLSRVGAGTCVRASAGAHVTVALHRILARVSAPAFTLVQCENMLSS